MTKEAPAPRRVRRSVRRAAIIGFALLLPIAAHSLWDYVELRRLVREIETIKARGEPVTELQAAGGYHQMTPDEEVPGRLYLAAGMLGHPVVVKDRRTASAGPSASALVLFNEYLAGRPRAGFDLQEVSRRLAGVSAEGAGALALVDRATKLPFGRFPPGTEYSYRTSELLTLLELLSIRTAHYSLARDGESAVASATASLEARSALARADWFVASLGPARRDVAAVLSFANPSADALRQWQDRVAGEENRSNPTAELMAQRAAFIDVTFRQFYGGDAAVPTTYRLPYRSFAFYVWRPWFTRSVVRALRGWNEYVAASRTPWPEKRRALGAVYATYFAPIDQRPLAKGEGFWTIPRQLRFVPWMTPGPRTSRSADDLTITRASAVAIAVARYRMDHDGQLPATLDDLRPSYLAEVPIDPETGKPLLYRRDGDAYTIYGVGQDGVDNGGELKFPRGRGPGIPEGPDIGVRVLLQPNRS